MSNFSCALVVELGAGAEGAVAAIAGDVLRLIGDPSGGAGTGFLNLGTEGEPTVGIFTGTEETGDAPPALPLVNDDAKEGPTAVGIFTGTEELPVNGLLKTGGSTSGLPLGEEADPAPKPFVESRLSLIAATGANVFAGANVLSLLRNSSFTPFISRFNISPFGSPIN